MEKSNRKVKAKKGNTKSFTSNLGLHFNLLNGDMPSKLISKMLEFLDNTVQTNLQLQLISKRWYLTATNSMQDIWHSFLFRLHDHLPEQLVSDKFDKLKSAKFLIGYLPEEEEDDDEVSPLFFSPMPSKHNQLEYLCIENVDGDNGEGAVEAHENIIMNIISIQENLQQLCLCGLSDINLFDCVQFLGLLSIHIIGCNVQDELLLKISQNSPFLRDLILTDTVTAYSGTSDDENLESYSNIGVNAILQNCTALECLELGGSFDWYSDALLNRDMFQNMSCFNLKRVSLGSLQLMDDAGIILLCDNIIRLEEFYIERGMERLLPDRLTTHVSMDYLVKKFSGSLTLFFDECHEYSASQIHNFSLILEHAIEVVLFFDRSDESLTQEILETNFKETSASKWLKKIQIGNCQNLITPGRFTSQLSFWDSQEPKVMPTNSKFLVDMYYNDEINDGSDYESHRGENPAQIYRN